MSDCPNAATLCARAPSFGYERVVPRTLAPNTACAAAALLLALPWCWPASAAGPLFATERMLASAGNECLGVPQCSVEKSAKITVAAGGGQTFAVTCPAAKPHPWHWDSVQHEHLKVSLVGRTRTAMTFNAVDLAGAPGWVQVAVGCSAEPFRPAGTGFMVSRGSVPSQQRTFQGGQPQ